MVVDPMIPRRENPSFPSGLMRRIGYADALEGRRREHGSPEYLAGYEAGLRARRSV